MKKIKAFLTVLALTVSVMGFAQNITVTGSVIDASTKEGVPFAAIQIKGTSQGSQADVDGNYSISVAKNATLVFSSIGYETSEVAVAGKTQINVSLKSDNMLQETVVVGYGSAKKVGNLVGSISTVKADVVKNAPSSSALDQLQGQVAGLNVLTTGGVAGDNSVSMTLHGTGSLGSSSEPLFVIDGVPSSSRSIMAMNPNDILSISVLKDATATSIYGARAANGVVFVTTKTGNYDSKATVTVRSQYGISTLANMQFYDNMMSGDELKDFWIRAGLMTPAQIKSTYTDKGFTANTKWHNYMQQFNNPQYQNDVTVEGGGQKVAYMIGASQFHQRGSTIGNFYDRYTVRSNVQARPVDWMKVGMNLNASIDKRQENKAWGTSRFDHDSNYTNGGLSFLLNPLYPAVDENGEEMTPKYSNGTYNWHYRFEKTGDVYTRYGINGNAFVEIEPVKNLKFISRLGTDSAITLDNWFTKPSYLAANGKGTKGKSMDFDTSNTITNTIEYSFNIKDNHRVSVLAGHEGVDNNWDYFYAQSSGMTDDRLINLQEGTTDSRSMSENATRSRFLSFFGHADYSFKDKYIIDGTIRNDASSRFGANKRHATFWAAGAMWKLGREDFIKDAGWIDDLNFKVSYGTQGNAAIGDYSHLAKIGSSTKYADASSKVVASPSNNDLTWEQQGLFTVALDGRFFDRLHFDVEFYNRQTTNMLMDVPYPYTSGFSSVTSNVGGLRNRGIDIQLDYDILKGRDYYLTFSTTFNYNKEVVTELFQGLDRWEVASTGITYVVGQPVSFYYPIFAGIDPADGAQMWYLPGEDVDVCTKDPNRVTKTFDSASLTQNTGKCRHEPISGGFSLRGGWKGISVAASFSYVLGKSLINNDAYFYANPLSFAGMNQHKAISDFWTPDNTDARYPNWSAGQKMQFDTHILEDASFMRLKNLQVGYSLPQRWLKGQNVIKNLQITFTGRNLFTLTNYQGMDPEVDMNLTLGVPGNTKQFLGGLEIVFGGKDTAKKDVASANQAMATAKAAEAIVKEKIVEKVVEKVVEKRVEVPVAAKAAPADYNDDLFFLIGSSELRPEESFKLGRICQILAENPDAKITITGHADSKTGTSERNAELSKERANVVVKMLENAGISASRISVNSGADKDASLSPEANRVAVCIVK